MSLEWVTAGHTGPHTKAATAPVFCLSRDLPSYSDESLKIGMFSMRSLEPIVSRRAWCACSAANHLRGQSPHWETRSSNMRNGRCSGLHLFLGHTAAEGAVVYPPSYSCLTEASVGSFVSVEWSGLRAGLIRAQADTPATATAAAPSSALGADRAVAADT